MAAIDKKNKEKQTKTREWLVWAPVFQPWDQAKRMYASTKESEFPTQSMAKTLVHRLSIP
jgi:hypothetical protein